MRPAAVGLGLGAVLVGLAAGDAGPEGSQVREVRYCASYIPLKGVDLQYLVEHPDAPLPPGSRTTCTDGTDQEPR